MANPQWPSSVPGPELGSCKYKPAFDNVLRSQMDVGAKTRRRTTSVPMVMSARLWVSAAQLQTILDFYEITLQQVLPFDWCDFRRPNDTGTLVTYVFQRYPEHGHWTADSYWVDIELTLLTTFQGTYLLDVDPLTT